MKTLIRKILLFCLPLLTLPFVTSGCASHDDEPRPWDGELYLMLDVSLFDVGGFATTRAVQFEQPLHDTEKLHSLRIIIVNKKNGQIVHNRMESITPGVNLSGLKFNVDFSTDYRLYLIGNEKGLTGIDTGRLFGMTLAPGAFYPTDCLEKLQLDVAAAGDILIDNSAHPSGTGTLIPMSESFDITTIPRPTTDNITVAALTQNENLFLTRAASKFSFRFKRADDYTPGDNELTIKSVKITGLGAKEYLIPNSTVYLPAKGDAPYEGGGREITAFAVPPGNPKGEHVFTLPDGGLDIMTVDAKDGFAFAPEMYFTESHGNLDQNGQGYFQCSISYDGVNYLPPVTLPELSSLPRNTHAIVNITVGNDGALFFDVEVLPWTTEYFELDFTHNIAMAEDGALSFAEGTYASLNKTTGRLVLDDYPKAAVGSFGISQPVGATWYAYLVTTEGELNAIQFVTSEAQGQPVYSPYITGTIDGSKTEFRVGATQSPGPGRRAAKLQVVVTMADGFSIPVNVLKSTEYGEDIENITFIQNPQ